MKYFREYPTAKLGERLHLYHSLRDFNIRVRIVIIILTLAFATGTNILINIIITISAQNGPGH